MQSHNFPVDEGVLDIELGNRVHDFRDFGPKSFSLREKPCLATTFGAKGRQPSSLIS